MVPPSSNEEGEILELEMPSPRSLALSYWVRGLLIGMALLLCLVLGTAVRLDPYWRDQTGQVEEPRRMETHRQLGLPPCSFYSMTGYPCPACGMTTSFALLMHGDVVNSLRANWVGTIMAVLSLLTVVWSVLCVVRGRWLLFSMPEIALTITISVVFLLMMLRWLLNLVVFGFEGP